jgi:hypothetical protein
MSLENLPKDLVISLALKLPLKDITNYCRLSKRFNEIICDSDDFWRIKLKQDFDLSTGEKNTKKIYEEIVKNQDICNYLILDGGVNQNDFVINSFDEIFSGDDYLVFLFLRAKIIRSGDTIPDYYQNIFNIHIEKINYKYGNQINPSEDFTEEEIKLFVEILKKNNGNNFQKTVIKRMINNDISLLVTWKDLCKKELIY